MHFSVPSVSVKELSDKKNKNKFRVYLFNFAFQTISNCNNMTKTKHTHQKKNTACTEQFLLSGCLSFLSFSCRLCSSKSCKTFLPWPQKPLIEVEHMQAPEHLLHPVELYSTSLVCLALQDHLANKAKVDSEGLEIYPLLWKRQGNTGT